VGAELFGGCQKAPSPLTNLQHKKIHLKLFTDFV
jgi:hypothetical protein